MSSTRTQLMTGRSRPAWRRWVACLTIAVLASGGGATGAWSQPSQGAGGDNVVLAYNEADHSSLPRSGLAVTTAAADVVETENLASARSSCVNCRTVAVAVQAVLITGSPSIVRPKNAAVAVNADCSGCQTFAAAYQYVVTTGGPAHLSADGHRQVGSIRAEIAALAASALSFEELDAQLDGAVSRLWRVIDDELVAAGGSPQGSSVKDRRAA
jgi:hypothetical protein